jgi:hypothetical protein
MRQFDYLAQAQLNYQQRERDTRIERVHLIREALAGQRGRISFYAPLLITVGRRLEKFGAGLQARYNHSLPLEIGHSGTLAADSPC